VMFCGILRQSYPGGGRDAVVRLGGGAQKHPTLDRKRPADPLRFSCFGAIALRRTDMCRDLRTRFSI
jgi:hypothetical protein